MRDKLWLLLMILTIPVITVAVVFIRKENVTQDEVTVEQKLDEIDKLLVKLNKRDEDENLEFIGEDSVDHTPKDEVLNLYMGNAFDIVGERKRKDFKCDYDKDWCEEVFEIELRNHKEEPVTVKVVETLYRWSNWKITENTSEFTKKDSSTIEFNVKVPADGKKVISYKVKYTW